MVVAQTPSPIPVKPFNLEKMAGVWYVGLLNDPKLTNENFAITCFSVDYTFDGSWVKYKTTMTVFGKSVTTDMKARLVNEEGNIWENEDKSNWAWIAVDSLHYRWALLADINNQGLIFFSREQQLNQAFIDYALQIAQTQGYEISGSGIRKIHNECK